MDIVIVFLSKFFRGEHVNRNTRAEARYPLQSRYTALKGRSSTISSPKNVEIWGAWFLDHAKSLEDSSKL
jgi:hypothetical protein